MGHVYRMDNEFIGVIALTHLLSHVPSLIERLCRGHYVYNATLKRSVVFHFLVRWFSSLS